MISIVIFSISSNDIENLETSWPLPSNKKPIVLIGAGGIVKDAHLPAYKKAGFKVIGLSDITNDFFLKKMLKFLLK